MTKEGSDLALGVGRSGSPTRVDGSEEVGPFGWWVYDLHTTCVHIETQLLHAVGCRWDVFFLREAGDAEARRRMAEHHVTGARATLDRLDNVGVNLRHDVVVDKGGVVGRTRGWSWGPRVDGVQLRLLKSGCDFWWRWRWDSDLIDQREARVGSQAGIVRRDVGA